MFELVDTTDEEINELKNLNELQLFKMGYIKIKGTCTFKIDENNESVGFVTLCSEGDCSNINIDEFEILKSKRDNGIGSRFISELLSDPNIKTAELYYNDDKSKKFWIKQGFICQDDGTGTEKMYYTK